MPRTHTTTGVSMTAEMRDAVRARAESLQLSVSSYVQRLILADLKTRQPLLVEEAPAELRDAEAQRRMARANPPASRERRRGGLHRGM